MLPKLDEIKLHLNYEHSSDILGLCETFLTDVISDQDLYIRPCQIGILLSVRVRVGFRVLCLIKKKTNLLVIFSYIISIFQDLEKI